MRLAGASPEHSAMVGDQFFTDAIAAFGAGVKALYVSPISLSNPLLAARHRAETPFRALFGRKYGE